MRDSYKHERLRDRIAAGAYIITHKDYLNNNDRRAAQQALNTAFKTDLEETFGVVGHPKADALFNCAWDYGHSYGFSEVLSYYEDMVELLT